MRFLNGLKTVLGVVGAVLVALSDPAILGELPREWRLVVLGASAALAAVGLIHKGEKRAAARRRRRGTDAT